MLAVTGEVGAGVGVGEDGTAQASAFKTKVTGEHGDVFGKMGDRELAWQLGDEARVCVRDASTRTAPSANHMVHCRECDL